MASAAPAHTNRLAKEKSPYLLQHAHNPVDWYPWGEEAFEKARREKKPIFLSIGYSTCHWCHVMERESFEDPATAELLNTHFVPIKVDREERPDVDALYMQAVMQMTGQGGWPLSVFLTPDLHPFYGGTYFPPEPRWGHPGFKQLLKSLADAWENRREEVLKSGQAMVEALRGPAEAGGAGKEALSKETLERAFQAFSESYDETYGGLGPAPKFPRSHALSLLLRYWKRTSDPRALEIVEGTLRGMAAGGIYDHVGGGFHRYSTDAQWHVPHFEKMLYDQALLARTYLEAYQATGKAEYARTAREIFDYVLREMTGKEGGFYSAEDADSLEPGGKEKKEGAFYVWSAKEIEDLLGKPDAAAFGLLYGVQLHGNAAHDPQGEFAGKNILYKARPVKPEQEELDRRCRKKLFAARAKRPRPHLDDKVLADWNGLMISSLAFGAQVLEEPAYAEGARRAADFILKEMVRKDGRLLHRYRDGEAAIPGHLEDYAFLVYGLTDLYQTTFDPRILAEAKRLTADMVRLFWDQERGGFFLIGTDAEQLLVRQKEVYDGAIPSGNSVAALDLLRVGRLTGERGFEEKASKLMETFGAQVSRQPSAFPQLLIALDFGIGPSREIVIAGPPKDPGTKQMLRLIRGPFSPNQVVTFHPPGKEGFSMLEGKPTAYVCENYACNLPTNRLEKLKELLIE
ncbi:MAG: thioredoxin domain-containing protein [Candidatus Omnitrophota bacterium]|nr:thioredoxin domain-containing protein [Candidatus Omnitrophota bacterium]